ncbi:MAG: hypothetical protein E6H60_02565 [Betaproteobacteria bacterium]|nr:MAG: hypothetical protein E6H60_02565 [Betaproteobacteria bacterium]
MAGKHDAGIVDDAFLHRCGHHGREFARQAAGHGGFERRQYELGVGGIRATGRDRRGDPVLKHVSFGHGVNITLGLPILRTSVDHGTALDLAAHGKAARAADPGSLLAAVGLAIEISRRET